MPPSSSPMSASCDRATRAFLRLPAVQRIGVQRPATALAGPDPTIKVCRRPATKANLTELLMIRCNASLGGGSRHGRLSALAPARGKRRAEPFHVAQEHGAEGVRILCPPLAHARKGKQMGEALLLCEKELIFAGSDSSLAVRSLEHVEIGKQKVVEPFAFLVVESASISPVGYPIPDNLGISDDEVISLVRHIGESRDVRPHVSQACSDESARPNR